MFRSADLICSCDGAYSVLRQEMMKRTRMDFSQKYIPHGYVEIAMPPTHAEVSDRLVSSLSCGWCTRGRKNATNKKSHTVQSWFETDSVAENIHSEPDSADNQLEFLGHLDAIAENFHSEPDSADSQLEFLGHLDAVAENFHSEPDSADNQLEFLGRLDAIAENIHSEPDSADNQLEFLAHLDAIAENFHSEPDSADSQLEFLGHLDAVALDLCQCK